MLEAILRRFEIKEFKKLERSSSSRAAEEVGPPPSLKRSAGGKREASYMSPDCQGVPGFNPGAQSKKRWV